VTGKSRVQALAEGTQADRGMQRANSVLLRSVFSAATVCAVLRAAIFSGADRGGSIPIGKVWETGGST